MVDTQSRKVLQIMRQLLEKQKSGAPVSLSYLQKKTGEKLGLDEDRIKKSFRQLEQARFIELKQVGSHVTSVRITESGLNYLKSQKTSRVGKPFWKSWGFIGIVVAVLALAYTIIHDYIGDIRDPSNHLVMTQEDSGLSDSFGYVVSDGVDPKATKFWNVNSGPFYAGCLTEKDKTCGVFVSTNRIPSNILKLRFDLSNRASDSPLNIKGFVVTLLDIKELEKPIDLVFTNYCGGGGGGYTPFVLGSIFRDDSVELPIEINSIDPANIIGKQATAEMDCSGECDEILYVNSDEIEGLELRMPFIRELPAGWYQFSIAVKYIYKGKEYTSRAKKYVDIVRPEKARLWWSECQKNTYRSFMDYDFSRNEAYINLEPVAQPNLKGYVIFRNRAKGEDAFYALDINSGVIREIEGDTEFQSIVFSADDSKMSPTKLVKALEIDVSQNEYPQPDIGILNLIEDTFQNITNSPAQSDFAPAWSKSGEYLAYISFVNQESENSKSGGGDIFIYNFKTKETRNVTNTPKIIERDIVWINDQRIAFLLPELFYTNYEGNRLTNTKTGIGIIDIQTGEIEYLDFINEFISEFDRIQFRASSNELLLYSHSIDTQEPTISEINLSDSSVNKIILNSEEYCRAFNTDARKYLCWDTNTGELSFFNSKSKGQLTKEQALGTFLNDELLVGNVWPTGVIIVDLKNNVIEQYSEKGEWVREWDIPKIADYLYLNTWNPFSSIELNADITLIPGD